MARSNQNGKTAQRSYQTANLMSVMSPVLRSVLLPLFFVLHLAPVQAAKVVFISGKPSHGPMQHEHRAGNLILAKALRDADLGIEAVVLPENGYPKDPSVLEGADAIVVFCTGHQGHLLNPNLEAFDALMKKGTGVVMIHWATEAMVGQPAKKFLEWMGGYCALNWSVNPHWTPEFESFPDHPVAQGLTPFALNDEWYYHMRFVSELAGVTPILSAVPGPETLSRPDGERSGNPHVRKAVANGESQHVAWTYQRPDGKGRGFGFTGAHNHVSWQDDNFRKVVLNAILWTAHVEVPEGGVPSKRPTDEEIHANLDKKAKKTPKVDAAKHVEKNAPKVNLVGAFSNEEWAGKVRIPQLDEARRTYERKMDATASLATLVGSLEKTERPEVQAAVLSGLLLGLEGRRDVPSPKGWDKVRDDLNAVAAPEVKRLVLQLGQVFGDESATRAALEVVRDRKANPAERREFLEALLTQQRKELLPVLKSMLAEEAFRVDAIRAFSRVEGPDVPDWLLSAYPDYPPAEQLAVIETLATRKPYAEALLNALEQGQVKRSAVPAYVARSLGSLLGDRFTAKYDVKPLTDDKKEMIAKYKKLANPQALKSADASSGRAIFQRTCMACHIMFGEGGIIGPELTGSNRADLDYLLLNILDPSGDIPDAYKMVMITTKDGQVLAGTITEEDNQKVVLSTVGQKSVVAKSDIQSRQVSEVSMMPEGLLQILQPSEVVDLIKYFQSSEQVKLPN